MPPKTVAIVGGGPAGSMAAETLARGSVRGGGGEREYRVTVFEERPGWEKPCGGALSFKALARYPFLANASEVGRPISQAEFVAPDGCSVVLALHEPLAIYSRSALNRLLLARAEAVGAEVLNDRIAGLERVNGGWRLAGRRRTYRADFLVLAGGARSRLRSLLAEDFKPCDFMLTYGYYVPGGDTVLRVQFFEDFEGYAWSFPRRDHLSVGICAKVGKSSMCAMRERVHRFMARFGLSANSAQVYSHLLPSLGIESWGGLRLAGKGWALAGDAAGLVDPVTGEGIYYAMRSGELLGESLLRGLPAPGSPGARSRRAGSLADYPARVSREFVRDLARGAQLAPMFYHGEFAGKTVTARMIDFARRSETFLELLQDLVQGSQTYKGLAPRLYRQLFRSLFEIAYSSVKSDH